MRGAGKDPEISAVWRPDHRNAVVWIQSENPVIAVTRGTKKPGKEIVEDNGESGVRVRINNSSHTIGVLLSSRVGDTFVVHADCAIQPL